MSPGMDPFLEITPDGLHLLMVGNSKIDADWRVEEGRMTPAEAKFQVGIAQAAYDYVMMVAAEHGVGFHWASLPMPDDFEPSLPDKERQAQWNGREAHRKFSPASRLHKATDADQ